MNLHNPASLYDHPVLRSVLEEPEITDLLAGVEAARAELVAAPDDARHLAEVAHLRAMFVTAGALLCGVLLRLPNPAEQVSG